MFGTKRAEEVKVACPRGNLADSANLRDAALSQRQRQLNNEYLIRVRQPVGPMPTLKSVICENFIKYTRSNLGTTLGMIIFEYARPPTDREKLVWILEEQTAGGIYFSHMLSIVPYLSMVIGWDNDQNSIPFTQRKYLATIHSAYVTKRQTIYFDDMLPHGRAESILMKMSLGGMTKYTKQIGVAYTERMRELYAKY